MKGVWVQVLESPCQAELTLELSGGTESDGQESYQLAIPASTTSFGDVGGDGDASAAHLLDESESFARW